MKLERLEHKHFEELYEVEKLAQPWIPWTRVMFDGIYKHREGWVVITNEGKVVGQITFSDYSYKTDVVIHCSILPEYHKRWLTKEIYNTVFDEVFIELELPRCTGFAISGLTPLTFHKRLGFEWEGVKRNGYRVGDEFFDLYLFGMLPKERRWRSN